MMDAMEEAYNQRLVEIVGLRAENEALKAEVEHVRKLKGAEYKRFVEAETRVGGLLKLVAAARSTHGEACEAGEHCPFMIQSKAALNEKVPLNPVERIKWDSMVAAASRGSCGRCGMKLVPSGSGTFHCGNASCEADEIETK